MKSLLSLLRMERISQYISDLLFTHECVIIPGVGGFVTNNKSAVIDQLQHKLIPPSKQIGFNSHLKNNDGLLADYIAQKEDVNYQEANGMLEKYAAFIQQTLNDNIPFVMDKVGSLYPGESGHVLFEPDLSINYSLDAFGLSSFHAIPVVRQEGVSEESIQTVLPKTSIPSQKEVVTVPARQTKHVNWKRAAMVAVSLPFVAYLAWIPTGSGILSSESKFQTSDLNPFAEKECVLYTERLDYPSFVEEKSSHLTIEKLDQVSGEYVDVSLLDPSDNGFQKKDKITVKLSEGGFYTQKAEATSKVTIPATRSRQFRIIAGCFGVRENAQAYVNGLRKKGYDAFVVDQHKGLYRVSSGAYRTESEASEALSLFKRKENSSAWLLR